MTTVWHSDKLPEAFPGVFAALKTILERHGIGYRTIVETRDIWCRDYMPVQASDGSMVQFVYWPRYLRDKKNATLITPPTCCRKALGETPVQESVIILDGGALEIRDRTGIVTERILEDNYWYGRDDLSDKIKKTLRLDRLIIIPVEPGDETGHVDGVVRFIDEGRVVMNDYARLTIDGARQSKAYGRKVESILKQNGLRIEKLVYVPTDSYDPDGMPPAIGCYSNFLHVDNLVILPQFNLMEDAQALSMCKQIFGKGVAIETVNCADLAREGGVLNCVSWATHWKMAIKRSEQWKEQK